MKLLQRKITALAGFTLMEMMVVIGIILLVFAFAAPTLASYLRTRKLDTCGRAIVGLLSEARSEAVTKRKNHHVVFLRDGILVFASNLDYVSSLQGETEQSMGQSQIGGLHPYTTDPMIRCELRFAFPKVPLEEMAELLPTELRSPGEGFDLSPGGDIVLTFTPTGTIEFGSLTDIPNEQFVANSGADIVIHQNGAGRLKGFIDIRPAGMIAFKIANEAENAN